MRIVADYDKIETIGNNLLNKKNDLDKQFSDLTKIITDDINRGWSGEVYEQFKGKSLTYIKNLDKTLNDLNYVGEYLSKASRTYGVIDDDFGQNMRKAGVEHEYER